MSRAHKFNAVRTSVDGISFPSKKEAKRYGELRLLEKTGQITDLRLQRRWPLMVNGKQLKTPTGRGMVYVSDFDYIENDELVIEDAKGVRTDLYKLKRAIMQANGFEISET